MPLPINVARSLREEFGFAAGNAIEIPDNWEPEYSHCLAGAKNLPTFYDALSTMPNFTIVDPKIAFYNNTYITLGLNSLDQDIHDLGYTLRLRGDFLRGTFHKPGKIKEVKICLKNAGKETDRKEYQTPVRSLNVVQNMKLLQQKFPQAPKPVFRVPQTSIFTSSVGAISRTGYYGLHYLPEHESAVLYALSHDVCHTATPQVFTEVRRNQIAFCGTRFEGEYEGINLWSDLVDPEDKEGVKEVINTSLNGIIAYINNSGLPIVENTSNKVEDADRQVAEFLEREYSSKDGHITALSSRMNPQDFNRKYIRRGLFKLCDGLPIAGTVYPENYRDNVWQPSKLLAA